MKKLLCATDHSQLSEKAEGVAAQMAKALGAQVSYVHVSRITDKDVAPSGGRSSVSILKEIALQEHEVLNHAARVAREHGIPEPECVLLRSHKIAKTIVGYAEKEGFDHIVVGSAGRVGLPRIVLGSIASEIIHEAHCPVTVVR